MSTNTFSLISRVILPCTTIIATILLFLLFRSEEDSAMLFYFNMCYTCLLEAIFFGYLAFVRARSSKMVGPMYSIMGVYSLYYIVVALVVMLIYSLFLSILIPLKFYIAAVIIISLVWFILGTLLVETDANFKESTEKLQTQGRALGYFLKRMEILEKRYINISNRQAIPYQSDSYACELSRLSTKIKSLMPNVYTNEMAQAKIQDLLNSCAALLNEIERGVDADKANVAARVKCFVDSSIDEIELLKSLTIK